MLLSLLSVLLLRRAIQAFGIHATTDDACLVAVVLSSRQMVSTVETVAPLWASLDFPCQYHLSLAISNVTLHADELEVYTKLANERPRTYLTVLQDWQDYQVERNLAIKVGSVDDRATHEFIDS
jgi:hypothetical protein